jgi:hypothetical protein
MDHATPVGAGQWPGTGRCRRLTPLARSISSAYRKPHMFWQHHARSTRFRPIDPDQPREMFVRIRTFAASALVAVVFTGGVAGVAAAAQPPGPPAGVAPGAQPEGSPGPRAMIDARPVPTGPNTGRTTGPNVGPLTGAITGRARTVEMAPAAPSRGRPDSRPVQRTVGSGRGGVRLVPGSRIPGRAGRLLLDCPCVLAARAWVGRLASRAAATTTS